MINLCLQKSHLIPTTEIFLITKLISTCAVDCVLLTQDTWFVSSGKRDEVVIKVQKERGAGDRWWFNQQGAQDEMLLTLHSPADAMIGQYSLAVLMMSPEGHIVEKKEKLSFHLLYNPWCKGKVQHKICVFMFEEFILATLSLSSPCVYQMMWCTCLMRLCFRSIS